MQFDTLFKNLDLKALLEIQNIISPLITSIKNTEPASLRKLSSPELIILFDQEKNPERIKKIQTEIDYRKERQLSMYKGTCSDGSVEERWTTNCQNCREDGPQIIIRRKDGSLCREGWAISRMNDYNRPSKDGPTVINYDEKERIISEEYRENAIFIKRIKYEYA